MMIGISAMRAEPKIENIKPAINNDVELTPNRQNILNLYLSGVKSIMEISKKTNLSDSFVGTSLRQFADLGLIEREKMVKESQRANRKQECLVLVKAGEDSIPTLAEKINISVGAIRKYLLELKNEKHIVYHPGGYNHVAVIRPVVSH